MPPFRTKLVPLFWASEGFSSPTPWMVSTTRMALSLPSLGAQVGFFTTHPHCRHDNHLHHNHRHPHHNHQHYIPPSQGISIGLLLLGGVLTLITLAMGALARYIAKMHIRTIRDVLNLYQICHIYIPVFFLILCPGRVPTKQI